MKNDPIINQVLNVIQETLSLEKEPKLIDDFQYNLGCDSLNMYELIYAIEKEFDIKIPDNKKDDLTAVYDLCYIVKYELIK